MTNPSIENIELFGDVNGQRERLVALNIGLTIYFPIPFSSCLDQFKGLLDTYLRGVGWSTFKHQNLSGTAKGYRKIAPSTPSTISDWLERQRSFGSACCIWLSDQSTSTSAGGHVFDLFGREAGTREFDSNCLRIQFPRDIIETKGQAQFRAWVREMLVDFPYYSGHLGYTLGTSTLLQVSPYSTLMNDRMYAVGKRFLGVEIEKPHLENYDMKKFIRSPGWVTFLSSERLEQIGGIEHLKGSLTGDFDFLQTRFGWGIVAGRLPQLGDRNRQQDALVEQRALAVQLEPMYSPLPAKLFSQKEHDETVAWLRRLQA
jgi:hypothetical protein